MAELRQLLRWPVEQITQRQWDNWFQLSFVLRLDENERKFLVEVGPIKVVLQSIHPGRRLCLHGRRDDSRETVIASQPSANT